MGNWLLDLLFPPKCVFCTRLLRKHERNICLNCLHELPETDRRVRIQFTSGCVAPLRYEGMVRDAILRYKFGGRSWYAAVFGTMIARKLKDCDAELVTWIPVSRLRQFSRGYDQAQLLAEAVAKELGLSCVRTMQKRHTMRQSRMTGYAARRANVSGAFSVPKPECVRGKRIFLIDDICTTGATMTEAAFVLANAGAVAIHGAVLALTEEKNR